MTDRINITWTLPFIGPFVVLGLARSVWWVAGAAWTDPEAAAGVSLLVGGMLGLFAWDFRYDSKNPITIRKWWINSIKRMH